VSSTRFLQYRIYLPPSVWRCTQDHAYVLHVEHSRFVRDLLTGWCFAFTDWDQYPFNVTARELATVELPMVPDDQPDYWTKLGFGGLLSA
jgi:hypothetical protein